MIVLVLAGCGSTDEEISATSVATPATVTASTIDPDEVDSAELVNEYVAQAAAFDQVGAGSQFPSDVVFSAGGAPGYSRYVFRDNGREVVPTLVEGPIAGGRRCQDIDLPCSFLELKELAESGAPIPAELGLGETTLDELVPQLDELSEFALAHTDVNAACADGFVSDRIQTPNMGSHFYKSEWIDDGFDPARPEILIYALADGTLPSGPVGQCANGRWNGEPMTLVGTSFIISPSVIGNTHPEDDSRLLSAG